MNYEGMDTEPSIGKNDAFRLLWGMFKEYIKHNIIMAVFSLSCDLQIHKKSIM